MQRLASCLLRLPHRSAAAVAVAPLSRPARSFSAALPLTTPLPISASLHRHAMSSSATTGAASSTDDELASATCEPCRRSTPLMPAGEHAAYLARLNENTDEDAANAWRIAPFVGSGDVAVLQKSFTFRNFAAALRFVNRVGELAEAQKHHPEIVFGWGHVEVAWWSHAIGGLHKNDFVCAAKTDQALQSDAAPVKS